MPEHSKLQQDSKGFIIMATTRKPEDERQGSQGNQREGAKGSVNEASQQKQGAGRNEQGRPESDPNLARKEGQHEQGRHAEGSGQARQGREDPSQAKQGGQGSSQSRQEGQNQSKKP